MFGIALILLVWINYTSRGRRCTPPRGRTPRAAARAIREREALETGRRMKELTRVDLHEAAEPRPVGHGRTARSFAAGGATTLALVAVLRRTARSES